VGADRWLTGNGRGSAKVASLEGWCYPVEARDQHAEGFVEVFPLFSVLCLPRERTPLCCRKPGVQATCILLKVESIFLLSGGLAPT